MVIDHLILLKVKPAYVYFDSQDREQTQASVIASLLKQLLSALPEIPSAIQDAFSKFESGESGSDSIDFIGFIKTVSTNLSCVAILLDAFDECQPHEQPKIVDLVSELRKSGIRVYITTRPHCRAYLKDKLPDTVFTEIAANEEDIKMFLDEKMASMDVGDELKDQITSTICPQAKGMYVIYLS